MITVGFLGNGYVEMNEEDEIATGGPLLIPDVQKKTHWMCQSLWQLATAPQPRYRFSLDPTLFLNFNS
ncbi:hypothetical protein EYF80_052343 [Liparis tanakae]|uniref:Uncharacterized protein n=1 Tax=Liparis tanakae TaxID=230148 RepID=A0A4Z2F8L7_9TELE|nr:hypothetical protein EYF80_052343 [Liparis tanakae]